jgi:hypothetical protein
LKLPADKRADAEEAFNNYITLCPAAQSVVEAITITHALEMADDARNAQAGVRIYKMIAKPFQWYQYLRNSVGTLQ